MQEESKIDPRVVRTRQLIQDAFKSLIQQKDIKDITVGDITGRAKVNRATFYAHFADKYELMDDTLSSMFREGLEQKLQCHAEFSRQSLAGIIVTLCGFHRDFSTQCQRNYEATGPYIEAKIKTMLKEVLDHLLQKRNMGPDAGGETAGMVSTMLGWSIYGITQAWNVEGRKIPPEQLAEQALTALAKVMGEIDAVRISG